MNHLLSLRSNIIYSKSKEGEYKRFQELIFLVDKPEYRKSTDGEIVRERGILEMRFTVSELGFEELMNILTALKNAENSDLT